LHFPLSFTTADYDRVGFSCDQNPALTAFREKSTMESISMFSMPAPVTSTQHDRSIAFIDANVDRLSLLLNGIQSGVEVIVLDPNQDGVVQITLALQTRPHIRTVHLVAHGSPGRLSLGNAYLSLDTLDHYTPHLQSWFLPFSSTLHLYACNIAAGDAGAEFLTKLHHLTKASIAASAQVVGNAEQGGTWQLESHWGHPTTNVVFNATVMQHYAGVFALSFASAVSFGVGLSPSSIAVGDLNGDGKSDVVTANRDSDNISVLLGNGLGSFTPAINFAVGDSPESVAIGDFNGDGKADLVTANRLSNNLSVLLGDGTGSFAPTVNFVANSLPQSVAIGDLNGDGKADLVTPTPSSILTLFGNGTGSFAPALNFPLVGAVDVAIGDFNGDGKADLAAATSSSNGNLVSVLLGNGSGGFAPAINFPVGLAPESVAIGDFNGDGKSDLVTANRNSNNVSVLLGNGAGSFTQAVNYAVGSFPWSVAVGDFNGDGNQDLVTANFGGSSNNVSVLLGNGSGNFDPAVNFAVGLGPLSVAIGDFNGDGKPDLATANRNTTTVSVLLNTTVPPNTIPTDLNLSATAVNENVPVGTLVGNFSTTDAEGGTFTYSLVSGTGADDNASFAIANGNELQINTSPDFEAKSSYSIRVKTTDAGGLSYEKALILNVNDVLEPGTLTFSAPQFSVNEDGTPIAAVTMTRTGGSDGTVSATVNLTDDTATALADYNNAPITVSFANGETSKTITIPIADDTLVESNETINLMLDNPTGGATIGTQNTAILTIVDNDVQLAFSNAQFSVNEDGTPITAVTVTRTGRSTGAVGATLTLSDGTATAPNDYSNNPISVNFADGETSKTIVIPIVDDNSFEGNETIDLSLSNPIGGATLGTQTTAVLTIVDNDVAVPGTLAFSAPQFSVNEDGTPIAAVTITRTGGSDGTVSATVNLTDDTATAPADYNNTPITVSFANGETSKTITIPIADDTLLESNETINLTLDNPTGGATIGTQNTATLTIVDNDVQLAFSNAQFSVNEDGTPITAVTVTRTGRSTGIVGVTLTPTNGTALAPDDYSNAPINITFADGETSKTVIIPIVDDTPIESSETINLTLSNPTGGATLGVQDTATLTIVDNDVQLAFSDPTFSIQEDGTPIAAVTVTRSGGTTSAVGAILSLSDDTATAPADYNNAAIPVSFLAGETTKVIPIPIVNDTLVEGNETINLALTNPTGGATLGTQSTAVLTLVDNDFPVPGTLAFSAPQFSVSEDGTPIAAVTVTRTGGSDGAVSATVNLTNGTATAPADYSSDPITVNFGNGETTKTVIVPIADDTPIENNETINLTLDSPTGGATIGTQNTATLTIVDNDVQLAFSNAQFSVKEDGTPVSAITVTRIGSTTGQVGATLALTNGTATAPTDYNKAPIAISFAAGETSKTIAVPIVNDTLFEGSETINLTLNSPTGGATLGTQSTAVLTIVDDDLPPSGITLNGTPGNDFLMGTDFDDTIDGKRGHDVIAGKRGNDLMTGGGGRDRLRGGSGNDTLIGGSGDDTLIGGSGNDYFSFNTGKNFAANDLGIDTITDFEIGIDKIVLGAKTFRELNSSIGNGLTSIDFAVINDAINSSAGSLAAKIIYNLATGDLFYNENGASIGFGNGGQFATLTTQPALTRNDFLIQS
jgi:Ca2+-binding RTX toxin-like protein